MKKQNVNKLTLNKVNIADLNYVELDKVRGGRSAHCPQDWCRTDSPSCI